MAASLFVRTGACGQTGARPAAQGTLTVTVTVVSSVGVEIAPDGEQRIVVANAVDLRDNVSRLRTVRENEELQDKPIFQGLKPRNVEGSFYAGINACSTPRGNGFRSHGQGLFSSELFKYAGINGHSTPSPGSVAQGRL